MVRPVTGSRTRLGVQVLRSRRLLSGLIKRGITAERRSAQAQRYHDLDKLAGTWSSEDADAFRLATADFARIDVMLRQ
jgi:hypothetical protein